MDNKDIIIDLTQHEWLTNIVQKSKNDENILKTVINLPSGKKIYVANYIETYSKFYSNHEEKIKLYGGLLPYVQISKYRYRVCNLIAGTWDKHEDIYALNFFVLYERLIDKLKFLENSSSLNKRLIKLESIFNHISEKSTILDEFIKISEEVINKK